MQASILKRAALSAMIAAGIGCVGQSARGALVIDLVATSATGSASVVNGSNVTVGAVGDTVNFNIVATVTGTATTNTSQGMQLAIGNLLSTPVGSGPVGDMATTANDVLGTGSGHGSLSISSPFNSGAGFNTGYLQDVNGLPGLDLGFVAAPTSDSHTASKTLDYVVFSAGQMATAANDASGATQNGASTSFLLGTATWMVKSLPGAGATNLSWQYEPAGGLTHSAVWQENGNTTNNPTGSATSGPGVVITATPEPGSLALLGLGGLGLLLRRRK